MAMAELSVDTRVRMTYLTYELKRVFDATNVIFHASIDHMSMRLDLKLEIQLEFAHSKDGADRMAASLLLLDMNNNSRDVVRGKTSYQFSVYKILQLLEFYVDTKICLVEPTAHVMSLFEDPRKLMEFLDIGDHKV